MSTPQTTVATGIPESRFPGPYPVGAYAEQLRRRLREFARVQLTGELWGLKAARARVYFELRDSQGALPCSMWRSLPSTSARAKVTITPAFEPLPM